MSYVALAELWTVPRFPRVNYGTPISSIEWSIAADGPMTAAALVAMGAPVRLLANDIGGDEHGRFVRRWLAQRDVIPVTTRPDATTPRIVVAADDAHTRTWFAHLPHVVSGLEQIDLTPVTAASFLYVDSYEIIEGAVLRAIAAARRAEIPILLNLGGSPLAAPTAAAIAGYPHLLVQTNVDDSDYLEAVAVATALLERTSAKWAVVTAGAFGAVAVSRSKELAVPSFPVNVRHTHCAGRPSQPGCSTVCEKGGRCCTASDWDAPVGRCDVHDTTAHHCRASRSCWRSSTQPNHPHRKMPSR
ncbi:carbohydrate kinase family protein [Nocardia africana]|uniref:carbohydrate kinase family protein n=1 Tax=Nocardia africana TaxID=134964 RepID=UPI001C68790D|nr:carbohydrate kinase family protein [Nocardia africana]